MNSTIVAVELDRQIPPGVVSAIGPWPTLAYVRGQYARHDGGDVAGTCGIDTPLSFALVELLPTIKHKCHCRIIRPLTEEEANAFTLVRATRRHVSDFGQYPPMPMAPVDWLMVGRAQWSRSFEGTPGGTYFVHGIAGWAVIRPRTTMIKHLSTCPCCGEPFTPDTLECGGDGEGSCFGMLAALSDDPEGEWDALCDDPYPGDAVMEEWRRRYDAFVASLAR